MSLIKKLILFSIAFVSCESFAREVDAIQSALHDPVVLTNISTIARVDVVNAYHCPDCYDIEITGSDDEQRNVAVEVRTQSDGVGHMSVKILNIAK